MEEPDPARDQLDRRRSHASRGEPRAYESLEPRFVCVDSKILAKHGEATACNTDQRLSVARQLPRLVRIAGDFEPVSVVERNGERAIVGRNCRLHNTLEQSEARGVRAIGGVDFDDRVARHKSEWTVDPQVVVKRRGRLGFIRVRKVEPEADRRKGDQ